MEVIPGEVLEVFAAPSTKHGGVKTPVREKQAFTDHDRGSLLRGGNKHSLCKDYTIFCYWTRENFILSAIGQ